MAQMTLFKEWVFKVNDEEMVIILSALGGRMKQDAVRDKAREIGNRLTVQRLKELEEVTGRLRKALAHETPCE